MTVPARRPATYEDILTLPENVVGEIIDGELIVSPRPAPRHADAASSLGGMLIPPFRFGDGGPGGWRILHEPELHLGEHVLVPDLSGWRLERMPSLPQEAFFTLVPDWVCEVLSPGTSRVDRTQKLPSYARVGVAHAWLIDPAIETLEVYALHDGRWVLLGTHGGDEAVRVKPFEALELRLGRLWGRAD
jgi:Uma2 family endonuclease